MLRLSEIRKTYAGGLVALDGITLDIGPGMFGLLGPNGAGKSTLMKILATLLLPDSGSVTLFDIDVRRDPSAARRILGYLPQDLGLYPDLTAEETLHYFARLKGVADRRRVCDQLLERVNLADKRNERVGEFSGGTRQRLGIAQALLGEPKLLIVDEPTAGLDPDERARFHEILGELAGRDTVVLLSTHIVADVATVCSRFAMLSRGRIVSTDTPADAVRELEGTVWEATFPAKSLPHGLRVLARHFVEGGTRVRVLAEAQPLPEFRPAVPTLEDAYFARVE